MPRLFLILSLLLSLFSVQAQELNCRISIDAVQTGEPNQQVYNTLQQQLTEFVNNTKWTDNVIKNQERIDCNMSIIITERVGDNFAGSIQIQSSRTVFDSTYDSPIYNYNDRQFSFNYVEFQPLNFNLNSFDTNLTAIIAYHVYTIIGLDADTFQLNGGVQYFEIAKQIVNTAASSGYVGWRPTDGVSSRYRYNDDILSAVYQEVHNAMYNYHRKGLDIMSQNPKDAKLRIIDAIGELKSINDRRPNSFLLRTFFDAKSDEIQSIFSGGPQVDIVGLIDNLNKMAPTKRSNWSQISY